MGQTPLHFAACYNAVNACEVLVGNMIKDAVGESNQAKRTPVHAAMLISETPLDYFCAMLYFEDCGLDQCFSNWGTGITFYGDVKAL